ncbi:hypothetical protein HJA90_10660 [Rhizobium bangladeshense]|uniref:hypothetical protein n=1 Tax=Rhizobium bangladeshense TaxID=1138189 RepID=UPI001C833933|nr:hypothetical protein [Rhizobium bangladeshense]MBX4884044.1 hypothetical protein [Rhizobium bangladeshense]
MHEPKKSAEVVSGDAEISGIGADRHIADRRLAAESAVEAIVPQGVEGTKVELVPGARLEISVLIRRLEPFLIGIFFGQLVEPGSIAGRTFSVEPIKEGF